MPAFSLLLPSFTLSTNTLVIERSVTISHIYCFGCLPCPFIFSLYSLLYTRFYAFPYGWLLPSLPLHCFYKYTSFYFFRTHPEPYQLIWALSLSRHKPSHLFSHYIPSFFVYHILLLIHNHSLPTLLRMRFTYINFTDNQLSPTLISLSLLTTIHPSLLPQTRVQSSILPFRITYFNLIMASSVGFGSYHINLYILSIHLHFTT